MNTTIYFVFFFQSVSIFMTVFFFIQYIIIKRKEHLNYALYLLCISIYYLLAVPEILFNIPLNDHARIDAFNLFKRPLQFLSSVFYTFFVIYYLGLKSRSVFLFKFFKVLIILYVFAAVACLICNLLKIPYNPVYYLFSLLLFPLQIYILITLFKHKVPYSNYIIWGSIVVVISSSITLLLSLYLLKYEPDNLYANAQSYLPVQFGLMIDMFLFTIALQKKIADNEKALINSAFVRQQAVLIERERIIADLHDDVGGGLSSIRMMSDLMVQQSPAGNNPNFATFAAKISSTSKDIAHRMHTIIWSLNVENDTLGNFIEYVRQYGVSFYENSTVNFQCNCPMPQPDEIHLTGVQRKNLFLIMKEAFHNIIKHSSANETLVEIGMIKKNLTIRIYDNGKGIDNNLIPLAGSGNGLKNMKKRMEEIKGTINFSSVNGTEILIRLEL